jgi:HEAT repeat protein
MNDRNRGNRVNQLVSVVLDKRRDRWARIDAARALAATQSNAAFHALGGVLADVGDDSTLRQSIAQALGESGDARVLDAVIHVALNPYDNDMVRTFAIKTLRAFKDRRALTALVDVLRDVEDPAARRLAANTLGQTGSRAAVAPLVRALADRDSGVRGDAAKALGDIGDAEAVESLVEILNDRQEENAVRMLAGLSLGNLGDASVAQSLGRVCVDPSEAAQLRGGAAIGWAKLNDEAAFDPILHMLADPDKTLRRFVAIALGWLGDARAVEPLIRALQADESSEVRKQAAWALDRVGDTRAVEPLIAALADEEPGVRWDVVQVLAQFKDVRSIEPLIGALEQNDGYVRTALIAALGEVGDERAIPALEWAGGNSRARYPDEYSFKIATDDAIARIRERLRGQEQLPD